MIYFVTIGILATISLVTSFLTNKWFSITSRVSAYATVSVLMYTIYLVADFASQVANVLTHFMQSV
jgi:hypothetical protein